MTVAKLAPTPIFPLCITSIKLTKLLENSSGFKIWFFTVEKLKKYCFDLLMDQSIKTTYFITVLYEAASHVYELKKQKLINRAIFIDRCFLLSVWLV